MSQLGIDHSTTVDTHQESPGSSGSCWWQPSSHHQGPSQWWYSPVPEVGAAKEQTQWILEKSTILTCLWLCTTPYQRYVIISVAGYQLDPPFPFPTTTRWVDWGSDWDLGDWGQFSCNSNYKDKIVFSFKLCILEQASIQITECFLLPKCVLQVTAAFSEAAWSDFIEDAELGDCPSSSLLMRSEI